MPLPPKALALTGLMAIGALTAVGYGLHDKLPVHDYRFGVLFVLALVTARLKVKLPGLNGNMAVNLPFLIIAATQFGLMEALLVALRHVQCNACPREAGSRSQYK
jgi:hypothetical protein